MSEDLRTSNVACFWLRRNEDVTGVSGTGIVAEGVRFSNGCCVLRWLSDVSSIAIYARVEDVETIHGHGGTTEIVWEET